MEINSLVKEYLKQQGYSETLALLEQETNEKIQRNTGGNRKLYQQLQVNKVPRSQTDLAGMPALYTRFIEDKVAEE